MTLLIVLALLSFISLAHSQLVYGLPTYFQTQIFTPAHPPPGRYIIDPKGFSTPGLVYDTYGVAYTRWYNPLPSVYISFNSVDFRTTIFTTTQTASYTGVYAAITQVKVGYGACNFQLQQYLADSRPGISTFTVNLLIVNKDRLNAQCPGCFAAYWQGDTGNISQGSASAEKHATPTIPPSAINSSHDVISFTLIQSYGLANWKYNASATNSYFFIISIAPDPLDISKTTDFTLYYTTNCGPTADGAIYYGISFNVFIFDKDLIKKHSSMTIFSQIGYKYGFNGNSNNTIGSLTTAQDKFAVLCGISAIKYQVFNMNTIQPLTAFKYSITFNDDFSLTLSLDNASNQRINVSAMVILQQFCLDPLFPYNQGDGSCTNSCTATAGYYHNYAKMECKKCTGQFCQTCSEIDPSICLSCDPASNRHLQTSISPASCIVNPGYYQSLGATNENSTATPCPLNCISCVNGSSCDTCLIGYQWNSNTTSCTPTIDNCLTLVINPSTTLTPFVCIQCNTSYTLMGKRCGLQCDNPLCADCSGNPSVCKRCRLLGYDLRDGGGDACKYSLCGDKIILPPWEECDDGNSLSLDGCSSSCQLQSSFRCDNQSYLRTDYFTTPHCTYTKSPSLVFKSVEKLQNANQLRIVLEIERNQSYMLENVNLKNLLGGGKQSILSLLDAQISNPNPTKFDLSSVSRLLQAPSSGTYDLILLFSYTSPVQSLPYTLTLDLSSLGLPIFQSTPPMSISLSLTPGNNLLANYYSPEEYSYAGSIALIAIVMSSIGVIVFLLSLMLKGKVIAIEMMGVAQLVYLSIFGSGILNPSLLGLTAFRFANGFNSISGVRPFDYPHNSPTLIGLSLYPTFLNNFNISSLFILIPLFLAGLFLAISKYFQKKGKNRKSSKWYSYCMTSLKQYTFAGILFTAYAIDMSFIVNLIYGTQVVDTYGVISLMVAIIFFCIQIAYVVLAFRQPSQFGEFAKVISRKNPISRAFFGWLLVSRMLIAIALPALNMLSVINVFPLILHLIGLIIIVSRWPYEDLKDNVRSIANCFFVVIIESLFMIERLTNQNGNVRSLQLLIPVTIAGMVAICIAINSVMAIRVMYKNIKTKETVSKKDELLGKKTKQKVQDNESDDGELKKYRQQMYNEATNPLNYVSQKAKLISLDEGRDQSVRGMNEECPTPNGQEFQSIRKIKKSPNFNLQFSEEQQEDQYQKQLTNRQKQTKQLSQLRKAANMKLAQIALQQQGKYEYTDGNYCMDNEYDKI